MIRFKNGAMRAANGSYSLTGLFLKPYSSAIQTYAILIITLFQPLLEVDIITINLTNMISTTKENLHLHNGTRNEVIEIRYNDRLNYGLYPSKNGGYNVARFTCWSNTGMVILQPRQFPKFIKKFLNSIT